MMHRRRKARVNVAGSARGARGNVVTAETPTCKARSLCSRGQAKFVVSRLVPQPVLHQACGGGGGGGGCLALDPVEARTQPPPVQIVPAKPGHKRDGAHDAKPPPCALQRGCAATDGSCGDGADRLAVVPPIALQDQVTQPDEGRGRCCPPRTDPGGAMWNRAALGGGDRRAPHRADAARREGAVACPIGKRAHVDADVPRRAWRRRRCARHRVRVQRCKWDRDR
mmetsp:Transcript_6636/g.19879  ORF Transcript_6636/g.19879 Transcript_6636/m.19879 type:complete len:225 (+) Transcript_6636:205-879(+)